MKFSVSHSPRQLPPWFKQAIPDPQKLSRMKELLTRASVHTVCEGAYCPNLGSCWEKGVATFMILGEVCTRRCRFCAVPSGSPSPIDKSEPERVGRAVADLKLDYVVITSVTRDDLPDYGAGHFCDVAEAIRSQSPSTKIEFLTPDFCGDLKSLKLMTSCGIQVLGHNIETVPRLFPRLRPQADYTRSLHVLKIYNKLSPAVAIKSGFMVGLGESQEEIYDLLRDLRECGCDMVTIGQYLAPSSTDRHVPVEKYWSPEDFKEFQRMGLELGIPLVVSAPLVRSSFLAHESYKQYKTSQMLGRLLCPTHQG
jgi:lipoyl synthase